jgi:hypothetical protein
MSAIAERIRSKGLTQHEAANILKISQSKDCRIREFRDPDIDIVSIKEKSVSGFFSFLFLNYSSLDETSHYHDAGNHGFFSILTKKTPESVLKQQIEGGRIPSSIQAVFKNSATDSGA